MRLLVTRPQPDADAQAALLREHGHDAVVSPLLRVEERDPGAIPLPEIQALIVTSRNTLRALENCGRVPALAQLPVIAVGEATSRHAEELGFETVIAGAGTAETLLPLIREKCNPENGPLLYLTGEKIAFDLQSPLEADGFKVQRQVLYATHPVGALDPDVVAELRADRLDGVVLMSPATASAYAELVNAHDLSGAAEKLVHFCLSANVADALSGLPDARALVASGPTQDDLLALITREAANC